MKKILGRIEVNKRIVKQRNGKDPDIEITTTTYWPPQYGIIRKQEKSEDKDKR